MFHWPTAEEYYLTSNQFDDIQYPQRRIGQLTLTSGNFFEILFSSFAEHCLAEIPEYLLPSSCSEIDGSHCSSWIGIPYTLLSTEAHWHISKVRAKFIFANNSHTWTQEHHRGMDPPVQMKNQVQPEMHQN